MRGTGTGHRAGDRNASSQIPRHPSHVLRIETGAAATRSALLDQMIASGVPGGERAALIALAMAGENEIAGDHQSAFNVGVAPMTMASGEVDRG